ncbi:MAG: glycosyltransferase [Candidatus Omnitrophica bacterium]|nr:glycosyltransferase [Candidatus Omnitrophota bacterium]
MDTLNDKPFISVILPVKNAERFLPQCLESLNNLNYPKEKYEVIVSDSDSTDRTQEIAISLGAKLVIADGPSVCAARNSGFKVARGEIIAFSDADCVMDKDWLLNAVKYFTEPTLACVGGPSLIPEDETPFGKAAGFIFSYPLFTGGSSYGRNFSRITEVKHNPGCNAIYRRSVLEKVMPVDERFFEGEDVVMNKKIRDLGYRFLFTPDTKVWHYRSSTPKRFFRQNFRYAKGRVLMWRESGKLINPLHIISGFALPLMLAALVFSLLVSIKILIILLFLGMGFLGIFFLLGWFKTKSFKVALNVPGAIIFLLIPWSLGFMKEFFFPTPIKVRQK